MGKNNKDFVSIKEAAYSVDKSISTIRRFVVEHKNSPYDIVRETKNIRNRKVYLVSLSFLTTYFEKNENLNSTLDFIKDSQNDTNNIISEYKMLKRQNKFLKSITIVSNTIALFIILALICSSYVIDNVHKRHLIKIQKHKDEQINNIEYTFEVHEKQTSNLIKLYKKELLSKDRIIESLTPKFNN